MDDPQGTVEPLPKNARDWAMACHLMALTGWIGVPFGTVIGPLVVWLIKKDDHPFIDEHGKEAVNFQITMLIAIIISIVLTFVIIGIPMLVFFFFFDVILTIVAAVKASNGERYRYPLCFRFIS